MTRIATIHSRYRLQGGEDVVVEATVGLLRSAGHVVEPIYLDNPQSRGESLRALARASHNFEAIEGVLGRLSLFNPDVVHIHNTWFAASSGLVAEVARSGYATVLTLHNYRFTCANGILTRQSLPCESCVEHSPFNAIIHRCYRGSFALSLIAATSIRTSRREGHFSAADRVIVPEESMYDIARQTGFCREQLHIVPHFVDDPGSRDIPPSTSMDLLYVGRLSEEKGVEVLIKAFSMIKDSPWRLKVVGDGPLRHQLEGAAPVSVSFLGLRSRSEVTELMKSSRALVVPSLCRETGPLVAIEAEASGLGVVLSDRIAASAQIAACGAGITFDPDSSDSLYQRLISLQDDTFVDRLGRSGRSRFEQRHSPDHARHALEEIYRLALERKVTPG